MTFDLKSYHNLLNKSVAISEEKQLKCNYYIKISDLKGVAQDDIYSMLAVNVEVTPYATGTETVKAGGHEHHVPNSIVPTDITITYNDVKDGRAYNFVKENIYKVAKPDGTFGIPSEYLMNFEIFLLDWHKGVQILTEKYKGFFVELPDLNLSSSERTDPLEFSTKIQTTNF